MAKFRAGRSQRSAVIIGGDACVRKFLALEHATQGRGMMDGIEAGAEILEAEMKSRAPKGPTGDLAESMSTRTKIRGRKAEAEVGANDSARSGRYYAPFVELGHKKGDTHVPAEPFMRPALHGAKNRIVSAVGSAIRASIARIARGAG